MICREPFYLTERIGGLIVSFYFLLMGISINKVIDENKESMQKYDLKSYK